MMLAIKVMNHPNKNPTHFMLSVHWQLTLFNHISFKVHTVANIKESSIDYPYQDDVFKHTKVINKSSSGYVNNLYFAAVITLIHL